MEAVGHNSIRNLLWAAAVDQAFLPDLALPLAVIGAVNAKDDPPLLTPVFPRPLVLGADRFQGDVLPFIWIFRGRQRMPDGPLARLGAGALAPVGPPLPVGDVHLEIVRATVRALEAVITLRVVRTAVRFELIDEIEDVEGHGHLCSGPRSGPHQPRRAISTSVSTEGLGCLHDCPNGSCSPKLGSSFAGSERHADCVGLIFMHPTTDEVVSRLSQYSCVAVGRAYEIHAGWHQHPNGLMHWMMDLRSSAPLRLESLHGYHAFV